MPAEGAALAQAELGVELGLDQPAQGEVEIVATEQEVFADGGAGELDVVASAVDLDESEV